MADQFGEPKSWSFERTTGKVSGHDLSVGLSPKDFGSGQRRVGVTMNTALVHSDFDVWLQQNLWTKLERRVCLSLLSRLNRMADIQIEVGGEFGRASLPGWERSAADDSCILHQDGKFVIRICEKIGFFMFIHEYAHIALWTQGRHPSKKDLPELTELDTLVLHAAWLEDVAPKSARWLFRDAYRFYVTLYLDSSREDWGIGCDLPEQVRRLNPWAHEVEKLQRIGCLDETEKPTYRLADWSRLGDFNLKDCAGAVSRRRARQRERAALT